VEETVITEVSLNELKSELSKTHPKNDKRSKFKRIKTSLSISKPKKKEDNSNLHCIEE